MDTFGEDDVNEYYTVKIKYILNTYAGDNTLIKDYLSQLENDYYEMLSGEARSFSAQEKTDKFNALIADAKRQIQVENMPLTNNLPYYNGGRKRRTAKKRMVSNKRKSLKNKRKSLKHKSKSLKHKRKSLKHKRKTLNKKTRTH